MRVQTTTVFGLLFSLSLIVACSAGDSGRSGGSGGGSAGMSGAGTGGGGDPKISSLSGSDLMQLCSDLDDIGRSLLSSKPSETCAVGALLLGKGEGSMAKRQPTCDTSFTACVPMAANPAPVQCPTSGAGCDVTESVARGCVDAFAQQVNAFPAGVTCADVNDDTIVTPILGPVLEACSPVWAVDACSALWSTPGM